jgi:hypothetical protein
MKKILIINILICSTFLATCQENKIQNQYKHKETILQETIIPSNVDEYFSIFLKTFSRDSIFQVSRVKFPLYTKSWVDPENGTIEKLISKSEYTKLDFTYPEDAMTRELDRYTQKINISGNKCVVEIRGFDNGIYSDFFFEKLNGKWNLISWHDQST